MTISRRRPALLALIALMTMIVPGTMPVARSGQKERLR